MYSIGDRIVYGSSGIMEIVDIREERIGDVIRTYYVLRDVRANVSSQTYVPTDNKKLVSTMRPLLTRDEIMDIISRIKTIPEALWHDDNRIRAEVFREVIESADTEGMIAIIKAINVNGIKRHEEGKKNFLADESLMRKAEKMIYAEFSDVLGIPENEISDFIIKHLD
jgi:RNA polymerase-interacting CarD/CdnL/TRCF family regulator